MEDAADAEAAARLLQPEEVDEVDDGGGRAAVAVLQLGQQLGERRVPARLTQAAQDLHALVAGADVLARQERGQTEADVDLLRLGRRRLAALLRDRLREQAAVEVVPDRRDVARLLLAEQVAGAADLQVADRDVEAGAEVREPFERAQPLQSDRRQRLSR